jgi:hypothetical protein
MEQEKRRRVFRAGLSIKYGEPVDLDGAINGPLLHRMFLFFRLGQQRAFYGKLGCDGGCRLRYIHIVRTTRNCALPLIIRA